MTQVSTSSTNLNPTVRQPSLDNADAQQWHQHAHISYMFARHARHDLVNVHCSLSMFEVVATIAEGDDDVDLPPEFEPAALQAKMQRDVKQVIAMSNDLVLLSQSASVVAYGDVATIPIGKLLQGAVLDRLTDNDPAPAPLSPSTADQNVVVLGEMLYTAISTFYFQWAPYLTTTQNASTMHIKTEADRVTFVFPSDDVEATAGFARRLALEPQQWLESIEGNKLRMSTAELAMWLAAFIVKLHGGYMHADPDDPQHAIHMTVPTIAAA